MSPAVEPLLTLDGIETFYGSIQALKGISFKVLEGSIVTLLGANGAGKSTTLKSISGLARPARGTVSFRGRRIEGLPSEKIVRLGISHVPEGRELFPELTVLENLKMGAYARTDKRAIQRALERVHACFPILAERRSQLAGTLSGGEQQMLAIGRALMAEPILMLLDEPSLGLAPMLVEEIFGIIRDIHAGGTHGRKIRLIAYDHVYQPPKAVTNAKRLVERDHVFVMMGHLGTPTTKAIKDYVEEKRVPNIFPATLASIWTTSGKWHVGDLATYADQTGLIIDYLVKERKIRKIASFYQDDEYGLDGHLAGKSRLKHQYDLAYVAEVDYKRADIDFSSQAAKLKESGADAVILQAVYREPPRLAEQCAAIGYKPLFIGPSPIVLAKTIELGGKHVEGLVGVEVYPLPTDPGPFLDQYRADMAKYAPSLPIDTTNLYGYQKAALFDEALQRTGRSLTRD